MATLSKLHDKCKNCKYKNSCNNKKIVAYGLAAKHTPITIKMGVNGTINSSIEEIHEKISDSINTALYFG